MEVNNHRFLNSLQESLICIFSLEIISDFIQTVHVSIAKPVVPSIYFCNIIARKV